MEVTASHWGGEGTPLVLLHGFTDTWRTWTPILPALEARHEVFAPTLPGHHGGDPLSSEFSWETMLPQVERILDAAGIERAHLVGNSLGGWLALALAARGRALSVTGLCPAGGWEHNTPEAKRVRRLFLRMHYSSQYGRRQMRMVAARPRLRRAALRDIIARPDQLSAADAYSLMQGAANCAVTLEVLEAAKTQHFDELEPFDAPVRIAWGTRDRVLPPTRYSARLHRLLPDAEFVDLPRLGHLPHWDDPALVSRTILEFTARVDAQQPAPSAAPA